MNLDYQQEEGGHLWVEIGGKEILLVNIQKGDWQEYKNVKSVMRPTVDQAAKQATAKAPDQIAKLAAAEFAAALKKRANARRTAAQQGLLPRPAVAHG